MPGRQRNKGPFPLDRAIELYVNQRLDLKVVGQRIGYSSSVVGQHLRDAGIEIRSTSKTWHVTAE